MSCLWCSVEIDGVQPDVDACERIDGVWTCCVDESYGGIDVVWSEISYVRC